MPQHISVPFFDLKTPLAAPNVGRAIQRVISSGTYILGPEVEKFELEFAKWNGSQHCVGVASGTEAVALALQACGVNAGDEVITVSMTAVATIAAIEMIGAVPVFIDIAADNRCLAPNHLSAALTTKTKAILPVHLYGHPAPMTEILQFAKSHNLKVIEDCAQACGAALSGVYVGNFGDAAAFSFYPTKNLGAAGDGGAVISNNKNIAEKTRSLRQYGWNQNRESLRPGINSRLDELQAAILTTRLEKLNEENTRRRNIAQRYIQALQKPKSAVKAPATKPDAYHAYHLFVIETESRDTIQKQLDEKGIRTFIHYPLPAHQQPTYKDRIRCATPMIYTEQLSQRALSIPLYPTLSEDQIAHVCKTLEGLCE